MLDRIPLGGSWRIMTNHDLDVEAICELFLELFFPVADSIAITASCITKNQQLRSCLKISSAFLSWLLSLHRYLLGILGRTYFWTGPYSHHQIGNGLGAATSDKWLQRQKLRCYQKCLHKHTHDYELVRRCALGTVLNSPSWDLMKSWVFTFCGSWHHCWPSESVRKFILSNISLTMLN